MYWLGDNEIPFSLIFTKIDKISKGRLQENLKVNQTKLLESWEELPPILLSSSEKKEGRDKILNYIDEINKSLLNLERSIATWGDKRYGWYGNRQQLYRSRHSYTSFEGATPR